MILELRLPPNRLPLAHLSAVGVTLDVADALALIPEWAGRRAEIPIAAAKRRSKDCPLCEGIGFG